MARADQGIGAAAIAQRLGFAFAASLLAHGALLYALPGSERPANLSLSASGPEPLEVTFLAAANAPALNEQRAAPQRRLRATPVPPRYYTADELDRRPQILSHIEPNFPALALGPTGRVVLRLYVDEGGGIDKVGVESADRTGEFEASARQAFGGARFLPGIKDGVPVKSMMRVEVLFGSPHPDNASR